MSNTSIGRGEKGSKFWIQTLVTIADDYLLKEIKRHIPKISNITWLSPDRNLNYKELKIENIDVFKKLDMSFWPKNGPWWDAVATLDDGTVLLVEAKAHTQETISKCVATAENSKKLIKQSLFETHKSLATKGHDYDETLWYSKYYQLANRLTFLKKLSDQNVNVKLILLNIVNDSTHIETSESEWIKHYDDVFNKLLGTSNLPKNVIIININVGQVLITDI